MIESTVVADRHIEIRFTNKLIDLLVYRRFGQPAMLISFHDYRRYMGLIS